MNEEELNSLFLKKYKKNNKNVVDLFVLLYKFNHSNSNFGIDPKFIRKEFLFFYILYFMVGPIVKLYQKREKKDQLVHGDEIYDYLMKNKPNLTAIANDKLIKTIVYKFNNYELKTPLYLRTTASEEVLKKYYKDFQDMIENSKEENFKENLESFKEKNYDLWLDAKKYLDNYIDVYNELSTSIGYSPTEFDDLKSTLFQLCVGCKYII